MEDHYVNVDILVSPSEDAYGVMTLTLSNKMVVVMVLDMTVIAIDGDLFTSVMMVVIVIDVVVVVVVFQVLIVVVAKIISTLMRSFVAKQYIIMLQLYPSVKSGLVKDTHISHCVISHFVTINS